MNEEMELSEHSPEQLVALIQQGHPMYFEELFYRFLPLVKKFNKPELFILPETLT